MHGWKEPFPTANEPQTEVKLEDKKSDSYDATATKLLFEAEEPSAQTEEPSAHDNAPGIYEPKEPPVKAPGKNFANKHFSLVSLSVCIV